MIRGIILEGVSCSGKTSLLRALKRVHAENPDNERSVLVLGEHYSQVLQNIDGEPVEYERKEHLKILSDRITLLEGFNDYSESLGPHSRRARGLFFIYERFHLNHRQAFLNAETGLIEAIESRLNQLNAHCYLLSVSNSEVEDRLVTRDKKLSSLAGSDLQLRVDEYIRSRDELSLAAESSLVHYRSINTDARDWNEMAGNIIKEIDD